MTRAGALTRGVVAIAVAVLVGCRAPAPPPEPMSIEFAGCSAVLPGPTCVVTAEHTITVWVPAREPVVSIGGVRVEPKARVAVGGGTRLELSGLEPAGRLQIDDGGRRAELALSQAPSCPAVEAARRQRRADPTAARAALATVAKDPICADAAASLFARLELDADRFAEGLAALERVRATTNDRRRWFEDGVVAVYTLAYRWPDEARARALADGLLAADDPILGRARAAYHAGRQAMEVGDIRRAVRLVDEAIARAERLGAERLGGLALEARARLDRGLGRFADADRALQRITPTQPCAAADAAGNLGWHRLRWRETDPEAPDPGPALRTSLDRAKACGQAWRVANAQLNLALYAEQSGDAAALRRHLEAVDGALPPFVEHWRLLLTARAALARTPPDVPAARSALAGIDAAPLTAMRWRADLTAGRAALAAGDRVGAEARWRAADAQAARQQVLVPVDAGRGGFLAERSRAARLLIDLLAEAAPAEAAEVARQAIARLGSGLAGGPDLEANRGRYRALRREIDAAHSALRGLAAEAVPAARARIEALAAEARVVLDAGYATAAPRVERRLDPQTLELVLHRGEHGGWAFATDVEGTIAARVSLDSPSSILAPFTARIERVDRIDVWADGAFAEVDLHAASVGGAPLNERVAVVYRFPVPGRPGARGAVRQTVLVRDPRGDLPLARALEVPGATVLHQGQATRSAMLDHLPRAARLIYAGHGHHDGWQSALSLARGTELTVPDIATLAQAPPQVWLIGCETAVGARGGRLEIGLAHAFLLAGSDWVIGSTRVVPDALADRLTRALLTAEGAPPQALRSAQRALRAAEPESDWAAFRVWSP